MKICRNRVQCKDGSRIFYTSRFADVMMEFGREFIHRVGCKASSAEENAITFVNINYNTV